VTSSVVVEATEQLLAGQDLSREQAEASLDAVLSGEASEAQTAGLLVALRAKGETASELAGLAAAIRGRAEPVPTPPGTFVDTCGTGGGVPTFNVSTTVAFVAAGAGARVAKHGNRSARSPSGSADVLEALGARIDLAPSDVAACLEEIGLGFMFAPAHHPAFRHVVPVRTALGVRTVFNLLGPLTNPAGAPRQLIGVFDRDYIERIGGALAELGCERAMVVSGHDGMDEISTAAPTDVAEVRDGRVRRYTIEPRELGFAPPPEGSLAGGEPAENARTITSILAGEAGPRRDLVVLNAAAVIALAGEAADLEEGIARASESIDSGAAAERLEAFIAETQRLGDHTGQ
jgi:anthranilate phosphoribosyltransferase